MFRLCMATNIYNWYEIEIINNPMAMLNQEEGAVIKISHTFLFHATNMREAIKIWSNDSQSK
jgi:hypothetical protein